MEEPELPRGWPPLAPKAVFTRLREGYVLTDGEMERLRADAETAERLEREDPAFARAARRYRTALEEELLVEERREKLEAKAAQTASRRERMHRARGANREVRERKRERGEQVRKQVEQQREQQRQKLIERIEQSQRRTLVRETIQQALAAQSRADGQPAERVMFTHASQLGDGPGPGAYDAPPSDPEKGFSFKAHPSVDVRRRGDADVRPGPGYYDPGVRPQVAGRSGMWFGRPSQQRSVSGEPSLPGPGSYEYVRPTRGGGKISKHVVKSPLDYAIERSAELPGPGTYELVTLERGKSSSMAGRSRQGDDVLLSSSSRQPGPGAYDLPGKRVRGGVMTGDHGGAFLPPLTPGPGTYYRTPTVSEEREMRKLSRQVVQLVKQRTGNRAMQSASAPEALGQGRTRLPAIGEAGAT